VIHRQALLDQIEKDHLTSPAPPYLEDTEPFSVFPSLESVAELEKIVPWAEWGPYLTRWFLADDMSTQWITTTCGQRWVTVQDGRPSSIFIRDFNRVNINRAIANLGGARSYETDYAVISVMDLSSSVSDELDDTFEEHIESRLPYLQVETKEKFMYSSVFMSENWLLGILLEETDHSMNRVDIFSMI